MNYYRRYMGDFQKKTMRLDPTDVGVYDLMLDYCYAEEKPLPSELDDIYAICKAIKPEHRKSVHKVLGLYFEQREDGYHNKRVDEEIAIARRARENGGKGGRPKTKNETGDITGVGTETQTGNETGDITEHGTQTKSGSVHPPTTNHQPPTTSRQPSAVSREPTAKKQTRALRADDVFPEVADRQLVEDWLRVRKAKEAPVTATAIKGLERERDKAGITTEDMLRVCCERSWRGFKAEWLKGNGADAYEEAERLIFGKTEKDVTHESERI